MKICRNHQSERDQLWVGCNRAIKSSVIPCQKNKKTHPRIERSWRRKHKSLLPGETRYGEERIGYCREDEFGEIEECFVVEFDGHNWIVKHYPSQKIYGQFNSKLEALKSMKETITDYSYELAEREV